MDVLDDIDLLVRIVQEFLPDYRSILPSGVGVVFTHNSEQYNRARSIFIYFGGWRDTDTTRVTVKTFNDAAEAAIIEGTVDLADPTSIESLGKILRDISHRQRISK